MPKPTSIALEAELAGAGNGWTDLWSDVLVADKVNLSYGIMGIRPTDRVARPGKMTFYLNNSQGNSASTLGYYSPGHGSARGGFDLGIAVRLKITYGGTDYYKFRGTLREIIPVTGQKRERKTKCIVTDFMDDMKQHKVNLLDVEESIRSDTLFAAIIANMAVAPPATDYKTGQETFAYAGDDMKDEKITALGAAVKIAMSEFGFIYPKGDSVQGGTLVYEDRHTRVKNLTVDADINDTMIGLNIERSLRYIYNKIRAIAYPREVGTAAETLFTLQRSIEIAAGATETFIARYSDPSARASRVSAKDIQDAEGANKITEADDERGFETGASTGWAAGGTDTDAIAVSTARAKVGSYSLLLTSGTDTAHTNFAETDIYNTFVQNDIVYVQAWVYVPSAWPDGNVKLYACEVDTADADLVEAEVANTATTGGWVRLSGTYTCTDTACDGLYLKVGEPTAQDFSGGAVTCYIDEVYLIDDAALNFEFSSSTAGGGDLNGDLQLHDTVLGANSGEYSLYNAGAVAGYVTILTPKGLIIRRYDPAAAFAEDSTSQTAYGVRELVLPLAYQDSVLAAKDWADITLNAWKDPQDLVKSVTLHGNRDATTLTDVLEVEPGDRIEFSETVSGIANIEYFVNGLQMSIGSGDEIIATWIVVPAGIMHYWILGTSQLGIDNYLGF